jgi:hypothetical protein
MHVPSNGTVVKIFTHPENDLDGEFYVRVRYYMDLMINSNAYEILLIWFIVIFLFIQYHFHNSQSVSIAIQENIRNLPIYLKVKGNLKCFLSLRTFMNTT